MEWLRCFFRGFRRWFRRNFRRRAYFPRDPNDWKSPRGWTEELKAGNATGGRIRHWKDKRGGTGREWHGGRPNSPGGPPKRGPWGGKDHWHDPSCRYCHDGTHVEPED